MRPWIPALLVVLASAVPAAPAGSYPLIQVTACDTLSVEPLRVRTTFDLAWFGPYCYYALIVEPDHSAPPSGDSTRIEDCGVPSGWTCKRYSESGVVFFDEELCPAPATGLSIVSNRPAPCVLFTFLSPLLDDYNYYVRACLACDRPVPARRVTWGRVKGVYR